MQLTVKDAAQMLNVTEQTIYRWIQTGGLPASRVANAYRINRAVLLDWTKTRQPPTAPPDAETNDDPPPLPTLGTALEAGGILYRVPGSDKAEVLRAMVDLMSWPPSSDRAAILRALLDREELQSTGIGDAVALPHVRNPAILGVNAPAVALGFLDNPIDFGALDGRKVRVIFLPQPVNIRQHLHLLARISFALRDDHFRRLLDKRAPAEDILAAARAL